MKTVFLVTALLAAAPALQAADSAYNVLRILGKKSGADSLNRVVEVRGRSGTPVPSVWKVVFAEPKARGGIREVEVQRGEILSERTPTGRSLGAPMDFNQLNLDSEGAFTVANQQAEKAGVAFDHVDYYLHSGSHGGAPVWDLHLFNGRQGEVASLKIAADSGTVLQEEGLRVRGSKPYPRADERPARPDNDQDYLRRDPEPRRDTGRDSGRDAETRRDPRDREIPDAEKEPIHNLPSFFRRAGQHLEKRRTQIKRFFGGDE